VEQAEAKVEQAQEQLKDLSLMISAIYSSTSWRLTRPVRWCGVLLRKGFFSNILPRQHVNFPLIFKMYFVRFLKKANAGLLGFPKIRKLVVKALSISPFLKFKIIRLLSSSSQIQKIAIASIKRVNDFSLQARHETIVPAKRGDRVLYVYVDHTINCNTNTGVQRVVRSLSASLLSTGEIVKFVKWEPTTKQCLLINTDEIDHLGRWSGPTLSAEERLCYPSVVEPQIPISPADLEAGNWLIVPEVTHITTHDAAPTLDLIMWAKQSGLRTGFVFYDAIPIKREEFADIAGRHAQYMTELLHADVVFPISNFAEEDLLSYWVGYDKADQLTLPSVCTIPLSGELRI
ncbi:MAG: hypothetical protein O9262_09220, partial [Cyclobacteriaceae bacterium]|nr:hypothetical protein [Cyclobacteriaceae bacterium]